MALRDGSNLLQSRPPTISNSLDLGEELLTRDLSCTTPAVRRRGRGGVVVGCIEWVLQQPDVCCLQCFEHLAPFSSAEASQPHVRK